MGYVGSYATDDTKFTGTTAHWQLHIQNLLHFDCENISYTNTVVPDDFTVSIRTSSASILAGQMFNLTCTVRTVEGLQNVPTVEWLDETGTRVTTGGDTIVGSAMISGAMTTLALVFSPLRISHGGEFTCRANITSPAPPLQLTKSAEWDLIVDSEYTYRPVILVSFPLKISTLQMVFIRLMSHTMGLYFVLYMSRCTFACFYLIGLNHLVLIYRTCS